MSGNNTKSNSSSNGNGNNGQELQFNDTLVVSDAMAGNSKELLYAHIYNYLLENEYYDTARQFLRDADVPITRNLETSNNKNPDSNSISTSNSHSNSVNSTKKQNNDNERVKGQNEDKNDLKQLLEKLPRDQLLRSKMIINAPDTFLLEWWQLFHLLNDFVESSSNDDLNEFESPIYDSVYPLLPGKSPILNNNNNYHNNSISSNNGTAFNSTSDNNNDNGNRSDLNSTNNSNMPIPNTNNQQQQQQTNYPSMQFKQSYTSNLPPQMGPQNPTPKSNSTQYQQPTTRRQMSSQNIISPQMSSQPYKQQMYTTQEQPSSSANDSTSANANNTNSNSNNSYQNKNLQAQLRGQTNGNNNDSMNNPINSVNMSAIGNTMNIQDPLMQQQYMAMLKSIMTKQPQYQNNINSNNNNTVLTSSNSNQNNNKDKNKNNKNININDNNFDSQMMGYPHINRNENINGKNSS